MVKHITPHGLIQAKNLSKERDELLHDKHVGLSPPITALTAYDYTFAHLAEEAGVEVIIVGDSLGMVLQGKPDTLSVTLDDMIYHSRMVHRGISRSLLVADMPFGCWTDPGIAVTAARALVQEGCAHMVKLEGGTEQSMAAVRAISQLGIPVCGHVGTLPQQALSHGYQAFPEDHADELLEQVRQLEQAGAMMMVLECVPPALAPRVTEMLTIPVIGIGSGPGCDGQVSVLHDVLGISLDAPAFSRDFSDGGKKGIKATLTHYVDQVRERHWP